MKKNLLFLIIVSICSSCNNTELKINESKLDKAGDKLQKTVEKGADTLGAKLKRLKEKVDDKNSDN